jgi:monoterpene epsilon-lactone hydrolase
MSEIDAIRQLLGSKPRPVGWSERRARINEVGSVWPIASDITLAAADLGGVACEWSLAPGSSSANVLMYFHGGGYCSGSIVSHRRLVTEAGRAAGARTLAVEYRLAPEHPYPAALADAVAAWDALRAQGYAAERIVIGGDSAGGNLTMLLIHALRERGEHPACAWLLSPWSDLSMSGTSMTTKDSVDPLIHKTYLEELASAFVPASIPRTDPRVSPLFSDLHGFPPTLIQVGSHETLLDDSVRLGAALGSADVPVTLEIWPEMIHAWPMWNARLEAGREALAHAGAFIRRHLPD